MTNQYITEFLLENGAPLYSFCIIDDMKYIDNDGIEHHLNTYPLGDKTSISNFIKLLNVTDGVCFIYNGPWNNCDFGKYGTWLRAKIDKTKMTKRIRKIGKINSIIFEEKKRKYEF